ncbi:2OG-Fe(II) oxygenase [Streptomyces sp. NPDC050095]|uniref:2OG-Fe(II) oxygenase n=1 Tax=unclassified Streptomyces TaxID=2593676 RepID=UPI00343E6327
MPTEVQHPTLVDALADAHLRTRPWPHAWLDQALVPALAGELARSFDDASLTPCEQREGDKTYRMATRPVDTDAPDTWPGGPWPELIRTLASPAYRAQIARLTGVPLDTARLSLNLWEYAGGDWLSPHVDKPEKLVTQIFYLSDGWTPADGGQLLVLDGPDVTHTVAAHTPLLGTSAVLVRSDDSWHAVRSPASTAPGRRSLTATFLR